MSTSQSDRITVACPCGARLAVPANAAGKKVKCPKCSQVFRIESTELADPPAPTMPEPLEDDLAGPPLGDDLLNELAAQARAAPAVGGPRTAAEQVECLNCGLKIAGDAAKCPACGHNAAAERNR